MKKKNNVFSIVLVIILILVVVSTIIFLIAGKIWEDSVDLPSGAILCTSESRNPDGCLQIYKPVCGWFDPEKIQCVKYPCASTYSNICEACLDENVAYFTDGECPK